MGTSRRSTAIWNKSLAGPMTGARTARSMPKGDDLPHVKRVRPQGRDYYYFDIGTKKDHGKRIYNRLTDLNAPKFRHVYPYTQTGLTQPAENSHALTDSR